MNTLTKQTFNLNGVPHEDVPLTARSPSSCLCQTTNQNPSNDTRECICRRL